MMGAFENLTWFNVARHNNKSDRAASMQEKISSLRDLVYHSGPNLRQQVKITFDGYDDDLRELCEIEEIRNWLQTVFFTVPEALALLDQETLGLTVNCCNKIKRIRLDYPYPGRKMAEIELSPEWLKAVHAAGLD